MSEQVRGLKTAVTTEQGTSVRRRQRLGGQGGHLVAAVGLSEEDVPDVVRVETVGGGEQLLLAVDATEDQMGMLGVRGRQEMPGGFDTGVDGPGRRPASEAGLGEPARTDVKP